MGLIAVVYELEKDLIDKYKLKSNDYEIDENTHEVCINDNLGKVIDNILIEELLGNISTIEYIANEIAGILPNDSIVLSKILYNGSHSGDIISYSEIKILILEMRKLRNNYANKPDQNISNLIRSISNLIKAAQKTKNPIVFV